MRVSTLLATGLLLATTARPAFAADDPLPASFRELLEKADRFEVVSIDPGVHRSWGYGPEAAGPHPLEHWLVALAERDGVFGRAVVDDPAERKAIVGALADGLAHPSPGAACYDPRHALVARRGDATVVVQICFACDAVVLLDAATTTAHQIGFGDPQALQKRLDALLVAAKVPLAREVEKVPPAKLDREALKKAVPARTLALLDGAESVELLGIDPEVYARFGGERAGGIPLVEALASLSADKGVRARAKLTRATARAAVTAEVARGLTSPGQPAHCYNPRHALVLGSGEERAVVFLCFECGYAVCLDADTSNAKTQAFGDPGGLAARLDAILAGAPAPAAKPSPK